MSKTVYICGASDCFPDPEFKDLSWMEKLQDKLKDYQVTSLAVEGASNFLIHLQIDRAIALKADFIIVNFTSCVRQEILLSRNHSNHKDLLSRFYRHHLTLGQPDLMSLSVASTPNSNVLSQEECQVFFKYQKYFFDIDMAVQKNFYFIDHALLVLAQSGIPFSFSPGGFEHNSFLLEPSKFTGRLDAYNHFKSPHNLWDYIDDFRRRRPYFHIIDPDVNQTIADYYARHIKDVLE